jgi:hypothetical protein
VREGLDDIQATDHAAGTWVVPAAAMTGRGAVATNHPQRPRY